MSPLLRSFPSQEPWRGWARAMSRSALTQRFPPLSVRPTVYSNLQIKQRFRVLGPCSAGHGSYPFQSPLIPLISSGIRSRSQCYGRTSSSA